MSSHAPGGSPNEPTEGPDNWSGFYVGVSAKGEYLYVDLGSETFNTNLAAGGFPLASFTHTVRLIESIGRLGLNYKGGSPVVARY